MSLKQLFTYRQADDESVDPEYELTANPAVTVQVCAWGGRIDYVVNEHGYDDPNDAGSFWLKDHGSFDSLASAMFAAVTLAAAQTANHGTQQGERNAKPHEPI